MIRSALISSLVLSLCLVAGCDKDPKGTNPPTDGGDSAGDAGDDGSGGDDGSAGDDGSGGDDGAGDGGDGGEDITQKVCDAEVGDYPAPYFMDSVLLRLPKGVTEDNFVEMNPTFAQTSGAIESVGCIEDMPGATISFMALTFFQDDTKKDLVTLRDETLKALGYLDPKFSDEKVDEKGRFYQVVLEVEPNDQNPEPGKALFQMKAAYGNMFVVVYETHPRAWNAIKNTFYESANRMSFLDPNG